MKKGERSCALISSAKEGKLSCKIMTNNMRGHLHHGYSHRHLLVQSCSVLFFLGTFAASQAASDILTKGTNLTDGETLLSANGSFTLGFFARGVPARRYLGIWFTVSNSSTDEVCWVANRDRPLRDTSGVLAISDTGNLLLLDGSSRTAWSSNTTGAASPSPTLKLLESGNLVVLDGNGKDGGGGDDVDVVKLWQSFDHPTNTLLPGAKIGINLWSGGGWSLTSWRSPDDPTPGDLRYVMVRRGGLLPEIMMLDSSDAIRYRTGVWNGRWFSGVPEMHYSYSDKFVFQVTVSPSEVSFSYAAKPGAPSLSRVVLNCSTGKAERAVWEPDERRWVPYFQGPRDDCDDYNECGHSGVCNQTAASTAWPCSCVQGFVPVSPSDWARRDSSSGCRRNVSLDCSADNGATTDVFVRVAGVKLPDTLYSWLDTSVVTLDECGARCLANCSCVAYAAADLSEAGHGDGTGCIMWPENLTDLRYVDGGQTLYLRQARPTSGKGRVTRRTVVLIVIAAASVLASVLTYFAVQAVRIRRGNLRIQMTETVLPVQDHSVSSIALATVRRATRNFSTRNVVGEGTFGIVYEGKLPRAHPLLQGLAGRTIAVKRLKPISDLPEIIVRYFTREMQLMSGLKHHRNVLRLLAYCDEANERILVYEYMHRRSLDAYIFGTPRERALLNWHRRLQIIQGIADGVKHLHEGEGSAGNVIHRDLKPANVLLDGGWQAKVADFGTAKLLAAGATGTRTRIGTPGYMAPEYVQSDCGETTLKCDVYSFGVTLLETLSGRRNCDRPSLVSEAWRLWVDRSVTALLDPAVAPAPAKPELAQLRRCIQVGLLCVQEKPDERPAMSAVVEMLGSSCSELAEPTVPMVASNGALATLLEADVSRPDVYETIDFR